MTNRGAWMKVYRDVVEAFYEYMSSKNLRPITKMVSGFINYYFEEVMYVSI
jgi:hypothetical protein